MAMQLYIADEEGRTTSLEIGGDQPLDALRALIEAELKVPAAEQVLLKDGQPLPVGSGTTIASAGVVNGDLLFLVRDRARAAQSASGGSGSGSKYRSLADLPRNLDPVLFIKELTEHPRLLKELEHQNGPLADAIKTGDPVKVRTVMMKQSMQSMSVKYEKDQAIAAINANPFDVEAQKKIEEMVRMENVHKNWEVAMEEMPESFGRVVMLYIDAEVSGVPIKAFVDSGAQSTIMSVNCAERCGLMRLLDTRFAGIAQGVGTAKILGRIHMAQLRVGRSYFPCTFTVLEKNDVDFLFGLDMLKRHQCVIDLKRGVLQLGSAIEEVPFLSEKDLPNTARNTYEGEDEEAAAAIAASTASEGGGEATPMDDVKPPATAQGGSSSSSSSAATATAATGATATAGAAFAEGVQELMRLGFSQQQATGALERAGGDMQLAASLLYAQFDG